MKNINVKLNFTSNVKNTANEISNSTKKMTDGLDKVGKSSQKASEKTISSFSKMTFEVKKLSNDAQKAFGGITKAGNIAGGVLATSVSAFAVTALNTFKDFESSIANTSSIFGIEKGTLAYESLVKSARDTASVTSKTAEESSEALGYMARAGWTAEESMQSLMSMIKFTEASQSDLATTSDILTDSMAAYGMEVSKLGSYLDALTYADSKVNATSVQIAESMRDVGGVFSNLNVTLPQSIALISSISSISKGTEAGTSLNSIFSRFTAQTGEAQRGLTELGISAFDSEGKIRDIIEVIEEMSMALDNLNEQDRARISKLIGGTNYTAEFNMLVDWGRIDSTTGTSQLRAFTKEVENSTGALESKWGKMSDTVDYTFNKVKIAWQELQISVIEPHSESIKNWADGFANTLSDLTPRVQAGFGTLMETTAPYFSAFVDGAVSFLEHSDTLVPAIINVATALVTLTLALKGFSLASKTFTTIKGIGTFLSAHPLLATSLAVAGGTAYVGHKLLNKKDSINGNEENKKLYNEIQTLSQGKTNVQYSPYQSVMNSRLTNAVQEENTTNSSDTNNNFINQSTILNGKGTSRLLSNVKIPIYSTGTHYFMGGLAEINEHGGEIVNLPNGSQIIPSDKSKKAIENNNLSPTINVNINGNVIGTKEYINLLGNEFVSKLRLAINNS